MAIFVPMEKVSIELFGLILLEPSTFVSDIGLAVFSFALFLNLKRAFPGSEFQKNYGFLFLFMGIATFVSGFGHLFGNYLDNYLLHALGWSCTAIGVYFMQTGSAYDFPKKIRKILGPIFLVQVGISILVYFG